MSLSGESNIGDDCLSSNAPVEASMDSPLLTMRSDLGAALNEFRDNWQRELKNQQCTQSTVGAQQEPNTLIQQQFVKELPEELHVHVSQAQHSNVESEQHSLAEQLFRDAVELEQRGKVYDALPLYRKALQIDPDIELRFYEHQKLKVPTGNSEMSALRSDARPDDTINEEDFIDDLYEKFQLDISRDYEGKLILSNRDAGVISTELHISDLPIEILIYILRWVVSTQLDMRSLEQCAAVCKGLYLCARGDDIWRLACNKVWDGNVGTLRMDTQSKDDSSPSYSNWRQMFIERERVLFNGCYISKTTYLRMGENSFQDQFYRPVQLVEYYRYIRFLPDGTVLMMTNADEPTHGVAKLKNLQQLRNEVLRGRYRMHDGNVTILIKKFQQRVNSSHQYGRHKRTNSAIGSENYTEYCIVFRIMSTPKRRFIQLVWNRYTVMQIRNGIESLSEFDISPSKYPPLWFSPVRSYHIYADAPLA